MSPTWPRGLPQASVWGRLLHTTSLASDRHLVKLGYSPQKEKGRITSSLHCGVDGIRQRHSFDEILILWGSFHCCLQNFLIFAFKLRELQCNTRSIVMQIYNDTFD